VAGIERHQTRAAFAGHGAAGRQGGQQEQHYAGTGCPPAQQYVSPIPGLMMTAMPEECAEGGV